MLRSNIIVSFVSLLVIGFTGLISIPFLTRMLSLEEMGHLFMILAITGIMQIFDGIRPVITYKFNQKLYSETVYIKAFEKINLYLIVPSVLVIIILLYIFLLPILEIFLFSLTFIFYSLMSVQWGILDTKGYVNFTSITRASMWVLTYAFFILIAYNKFEQETYIMPLLFMYISLYIIFKLKIKQLKLLNDSFTSIESHKVLLKDIIIKTLENIKIQLVVIVFLAMDKLMIPYIIGYQQFAIYSISSEFASKGYLINSTMKRVLFPFLARDENKNKLNAYLKKSNYIFLIALFAILIIGLYTVDIINIYAGSDYSNSGNLLSILLLIFPINILGTVGVVILHLNGDFNIHYLVHRNMAIFIIIIFALATYFFGLNGAVIGLLLSRSVDLYIYYIAINKYVFKFKIMSMIIFILLYQLIGISILFKNYFLVSILFIIVSILFLYFTKRIK